MDLFSKIISYSPDRALVILQTSVTYFSKEDSCVQVNVSQVTTVDELSSNQIKVQSFYCPSLMRLRLTLLSVF